jgi:Tfp pilus assembly protein PilP
MNPRNLIIVMAMLGSAALAQTGSAPSAPAAHPSAEPTKTSTAQPGAKRAAEPAYSQSLNADDTSSTTQPSAKRSAAIRKKTPKPAAAKPATTQAATPFAKPSAGKPGMPATASQTGPNAGQPMKPRTASGPTAAQKPAAPNGFTVIKPAGAANAAPAKPGAKSSAGVATAKQPVPVIDFRSKQPATAMTKPGAMPGKPAGGTAAQSGAAMGKPGATTAATKPGATSVKPGAMPLKPGAAVGAIASQKKGGAAQQATSMKPADKNPAKPAAAANAPAASTPEEKPTEVAKAPVRHSTAGMRDPFISPIVKAVGGPGKGCTAGKRCLVIDQIRLKGIVEAPNGMIAVVENAADRTYFLHENDPLFNGMVTHITRDSVVFRENITDSFGRSTGTRDVVKRVTAPVV